MFEKAIHDCQTTHVAKRKKLRILTTQIPLRQMSLLRGFGLQLTPSRTFMLSVNERALRERQDTLQGFGSVQIQIQREC